MYQWLLWKFQAGVPPRLIGNNTFYILEHIIFACSNKPLNKEKVLPPAFTLRRPTLGKEYSLVYFHGSFWMPRFRRHNLRNVTSLTPNQLSRITPWLIKPNKLLNRLTAPIHKISHLKRFLEYFRHRSLAI